MTQQQATDSSGDLKVVPGTPKSGCPRRRTGRRAVPRHPGLSRQPREWAEPSDNRGAGPQRSLPLPRDPPLQPNLRAPVGLGSTPPRRRRRAGEGYRRAGAATSPGNAEPRAGTPQPAPATSRLRPRRRGRRSASAGRQPLPGHRDCGQAAGTGLRAALPHLPLRHKKPSPTRAASADTRHSVRRAAGFSDEQAAFARLQSLLNSRTSTTSMPCAVVSKLGSEELQDPAGTACPCLPVPDPQTPPAQPHVGSETLSVSAGIPSLIGTGRRLQSGRKTTTGCFSTFRFE